MCAGDSSQFFRRLSKSNLAKGVVRFNQLPYDSYMDLSSTYAPTYSNKIPISNQQMTVQVPGSHLYLRSDNSGETGRVYPGEFCLSIRMRNI